MAKRGTKPPYTAAADVESFFTRIKTSAAPKKLDTVWVKSTVGAKQPAGIQALAKWLGIIGDNGAADSAIWNKVRIQATRPDTLAPLIRDAYSEVFGRVSVEDATRAELDEAFVNAYDDIGDPQRYVGCFLALCAQAGIPTVAATRESKAASNGSGSPAAAKTRIATDPKRQTTPKVPASKDDPPPASSPSGVTIALNVEIPADWTETEIRERISVVLRAVRETGVEQA